MHIVLPSIHVESSRPTHTRLDENVEVSSFDDTKLVLGEVDPLDIGMPHKLLSASQLRKIIIWYHILSTFI